MSEEVAAGLHRGRREIAAARLLDQEGFAEQAVSRSYYACFYAAEAALLKLGETRSKHSGVIASFSRLVVKEGGFDPSLARILRARFEDRNVVDYEHVDPPAADIEEAIDEAERFVAGVEAWIAASEGDPE